MSICSNCGNPLPDEARFCPVCGTAVPAGPSEESVPVSDAAAQEPSPADVNEPAASWYQSTSQDYREVPPAAPSYVAVKPAIGSVFDFYRKAFSVLSKKPIRLWALSLLFMVITALVSSLGSFTLLLTIPLLLLLSLGFTGVLLDGYHGKEVRAEQLFQAFRKEEVVRNGAGMCWKELWALIWGFVPVMNIIKAYSYSFVPFILLTDKEISATEALRKSMRMTDGYKAKMFWADVLFVLCFFLVVGVLAMLAQIPYIGFLFGIALALFYLAFILFAPLFLGLVRTAFFEEISANCEE